MANGTEAASFWPASGSQGRAQTSAASVMPKNGSSTTTPGGGSTSRTTPGEMGTSPVTDIPDHHHPVVIVMEEIEAEEEIPESSKEVEAVEEIFHHKGWIPIKYR